MSAAGEERRTRRESEASPRNHGRDRAGVPGSAPDRPAARRGPFDEVGGRGPRSGLVVNSGGDREEREAASRPAHRRGHRRSSRQRLERAEDKAKFVFENRPGAGSIAHRGKKAPSILSRSLTVSRSARTIFAGRRRRGWLRLESRGTTSRRC